MKIRLSPLLAGALAAIVLKVLYRTMRWKIVNASGEAPHFDPKRPKILLFWHGRQLIIPDLYLRLGGEHHTIKTLISHHQDGRIIAHTLRFLGFGSVAGSSTRGAVAALRQLASVLQAGEQIAVTPDGPRGPARKVKRGAISLARQCGVPIYVVTFGASRFWRFGSWDGMLLPKPFARLIGIVGEVIDVPTDCDDTALEKWRLLVETRLNEITERADSYFHVTVHGGKNGSDSKYV